MSVSENSTLHASARGNEDQLLDDRIQSPAVNVYDKSPYTDPNFVSLDVGPTHTIFHVHQIVLSQSPELEVKPSSTLWGDKAVKSIALPDLDEPTAHTLIHYLYSGCYQTLHPHAASKDGTLSAYKLGTCVYVAAVRYKLPGLAHLAKEQINISSEDLSIVEIMRVAREHAFPFLPQEEEWYGKYLEAAIQTALGNDMDFFSTEEFADQLEGDRRFKRVVMQAIMGGLSKGTKATEGALAKPEVVDPAVDIEPPLAMDAAAEPLHDPPIPTSDLEPPGQLQEGTPEPVAEEESPVLDTSEPTPTPDLETFTDEVGFGASRTYLQLSRTDSAVEAAEMHSEKSGQGSVDSFSGNAGEERDKAAVTDGVGGDDMTVETPVPEELATPTVKKSRKKKKMMMKKKAAEAAVAAAEAEVGGVVEGMA